MNSYINYQRLISLTALALAAGCTAPTTEMDLRLATQRLTQEFGTTMLTLPSIPCSAQNDQCRAIVNLFDPNLLRNNPRLQVSCDGARMECGGEYNVLIYYAFDLSKDIAFQSGIGQTTAPNIRRITLSYGMTNKLTFELPKTHIHLGPTTASSITSPGVVPVGEIGPFSAGVDVADDSMQLAVEEGTPAFDFLVDRIAHPEQPFEFLFPTRVLLRAGNAFPAGTLELRLTPILTLLKR